MLLSDYPGLERGLARTRRIEDVLRTFAMTPLLEQINGVLVRQLTPRHIDLLLLVSSPFLISPGHRRSCKFVARAEDVAQFLWIVSPDNPLDGSKPPGGFFESLRPTEPDHFQRFYRAIDRYYDRAMLDRPAGAVGGRIVATALSVSVVNRIAGAYSWPAEVFDGNRPIPGKGILDQPVARLYQYWRWIAAARDPTAPLHSRLQDSFRARTILRWQARARAAGCTVAEVIAAHKERRPPVPPPPTFIEKVKRFFTADSSSQPLNPPSPGYGAAGPSTSQPT